ncbi:polyphosphate kinase 2, partial [Massilia sp. YIM B02443]|nr:polyphosphate kinase 2 [Massilia sp. YIM B02443]
TVQCSSTANDDSAYVEVERPTILLPERKYHDDYVRRPVPPEIIVPEVY